MSIHVNLAFRQWPSKLQDHFCWSLFGWTKPPSTSRTLYKSTMMPCTHINLTDDKLGPSMDWHQCKVVWPMHIGTCDNHMQVLPSTWGSQEIHLQPHGVHTKGYVNLKYYILFIPLIYVRHIHTQEGVHAKKWIRRIRVCRLWNLNV
jgi:hypothetical protein